MIDADGIHKIIRPIEQNDTKWGMTAETAKRLIYDAFNNIPTIIEADKAESEARNDSRNLGKSKQLQETD